MKLRKLIAAMAIAGLASGVAQADPISFTFDPTGTAGATGDISNAYTIDLLPGSVLAVGGGMPSLSQGVGTAVTDYFQANLAGITDVDGNLLFSNGSGGKYFTIAAGYGETLSSLSGTCSGSFAGCTAYFSFDPTNPTNFVEFNATSAIGNNLTGTGFTTGSAILTGHIVSVNTNFTISSLSGGLLDQTGVDNWSGTQTIAGIGAGNVTFHVDWVDSNYFSDLMMGGYITMGFVNTSLIDPFNQVNPSQAFSSSPTTNGDLAPNIGNYNGMKGPDFIFQADTNASFARVVPEPASLALLGLALAGLGFSRRRQAF